MASSGSGASNERRNVLGHDFSLREIGHVRQQMAEAAPLLADHSVFFVALVMRGISLSRLDNSAIMVVDPILQAMLKTGADDARVMDVTLEILADKNSAYCRTTETLRNLLGNRSREDKFVPLHAANHWSLLYYNSRLGRWYHYDSLGTYHRGYVNSFMRYLAREGIVPAREVDTALAAIADESVAQYTMHRPSRQREGWECGFHVLMFMRCILGNNLQPLRPDNDAECSTVYLTRFRRMCTQWVDITLSHIKTGGSNY